MKVWLSLTDSKNVFWMDTGDMMLGIDENGSLYFEEDRLWKHHLLKSLDDLVERGEWVLL